MGKYPEIEITRDDLKRIVYFIVMKFKADSLHMQGTSAKRDLVGGYIERWFNKIAETVVFDDLLSKKSYNVVADYFIYGNDSEKNAPDIIGLRKNTGEIIPFVKYNNGTWDTELGMPRIEVKVIRKDQMLISVREPQMIDDYYVFIESDLEPDYLTAIFEEETFSDEYFKDLEMSAEFIGEDSGNQIIKHEKVKKSEKIGTMRLVGVYKKDDLRRNTTRCDKGIKPYYFANATNVEFKGGSIGFLPVGSDGLFCYEIKGEVYLPMSIRELDSEKIEIFKKNKGSVYIKADKEIFINGVRVNPGIVKIDFKKFDRSSSWSENISLRYVLENYGNDSVDELIGLFDEIV